MRIDLQIGGYGIRLDEGEDYRLLHWPLKPFDPFLMQSEQSPDIELRINVVTCLPEIPHGKLTYDACHGLWKLYETDSGYFLESFDTRTLQPRSYTTISGDISQAEVWLCGQPRRREERAAWTPMHVINPIMEACLVTRLAREGGLLLHAAGVLTEREGWVFTGASGAGKSTIADFYATRGARVLSDERIILRTVEGSIQVFGTPWPGTGGQATNAAGRLQALYCIRHGEGAHALRRMSAREVSLFVLPQCFLPHWDRAAMNGTLAFLGTLIETVDCFELAFMKTPEIVEFLEEQRLGRALAPS
jgi:hypothetical protein